MMLGKDVLDLKYSYILQTHKDCFDRRSEKVCPEPARLARYSETTWAQLAKIRNTRTSLAHNSQILILLQHAYHFTSGAHVPAACLIPGPLEPLVLQHFRLLLVI